tara:strand:+ start:118 stop:1428 length:1311 start_codon:yes stop_codon:yes gene_type:complete
MSPAPARERRHLFGVAWPIILSNLSAPLLGFVDTGVIGNLGDAALIGAIALGALIFSFLYWGFSFLRMGTTALVAQASGAGDDGELQATVLRAFLLGLVIGAVILLCREPLAGLAFGIAEGSAAVESAGREYFLVRIWGAPFFLAHLAILGLLLGTQATRAVLGLQLLLNGTNILLDLVFVVGFGWDVAGVAAATVIAEVIAVIAGVVITLKRFPTITNHLARVLEPAALRRTFAMNADIMVRTLTLTFGFAWFTNQGARAGDVVLASNAILLQFVSFSAFFIDGFALAAEAMVGHATGATNQTRLRAAVRAAVELSVAAAVVLGALFWLLGDTVVAILTNVPEVAAACAAYLPWVIAAPFISLWSYLLDGVFIGAGRTREMRNAMLGSLAIYLCAWWVLQPFGNHGLWLALMVFFIARAGTLALYLPRIVRPNQI